MKSACPYRIIVLFQYRSDIPAIGFDAQIIGKKNIRNVVSIFNDLGAVPFIDNARIENYL